MASVINGTNIVLYEYDSNAIYYFNGGTSQGTFDGVVCKQMSRTQVSGAATDFTKTGAGTIVSFITDANDPGVTLQAVCIVLSGAFCGITCPIASNFAQHIGKSVGSPIPGTDTVESLKSLFVL